MKDLEYILNWDIEKKEKIVPRHKISETLEGDERTIAEILVDKDSMFIDELSWKTSISINKLSSVLLTMEFNGLITALPGKKFKLAPVFVSE